MQVKLISGFTVNPLLALSVSHHPFYEVIKFLYLITLLNFAVINLLKHTIKTM